MIQGRIFNPSKSNLIYEYKKEYKKVNPKLRADKVNSNRKNMRWMKPAIPFIRKSNKYESRSLDIKNNNWKTKPLKIVDLKPTLEDFDIRQKILKKLHGPKVNISKIDFRKSDIKNLLNTDVQIPKRDNQGNVIFDKRGRMKFNDVKISSLFSSPNKQYDLLNVLNNTNQDLGRIVYILIMSLLKYNFDKIGNEEKNETYKTLQKFKGENKLYDINNFPLVLKRKYINNFDKQFKHVLYIFYKDRNIDDDEIEEILNSEFLLFPNYESNNNLLFEINEDLNDFELDGIEKIHLERITDVLNIINNKSMNDDFDGDVLKLIKNISIIFRTDEEIFILDDEDPSNIKDLNASIKQNLMGLSKLNEEQIDKLLTVSKIDTIDTIQKENLLTNALNDALKEFETKEEKEEKEEEEEEEKKTKEENIINEIQQIVPEIKLYDYINDISYKKIFNKQTRSKFSKYTTKNLSEIINIVKNTHISFERTDKKGKISNKGIINSISYGDKILIFNSNESALLIKKENFYAFISKEGIKYNRFDIDFI